MACRHNSWLLSAAVLVFASQAYALEPKQCLPIAELNATLKAEGQQTLIIGDRMVPVSPDGSIKNATVLRNAEVITGNTDGSFGYQLSGDLPRAQSSTNMCVVAKLTNMRLYDARKPGLPNDPRLQGDISKQLKANDAVGSRPMLVSDTFTGDLAAKTIGLPMVISGNVPARGAVMYARKADGVAVEMMLMDSLDYTPTALARLPK